MKRLLLLLAFLPLISLAQTPVTAPTITVSWNAVTTDIDGNSLANSTVTYKVYGSQGCGTKTLQSTTTSTSTTLTVSPGCYSLAVSASDTAGEGAVSPTLVLSVTAAAVVPAQVSGVSVSGG